MTVALLIYLFASPRTLGPIGKKVPNLATRELLRKVFTITGVLLAIVVALTLIDVAVNTFKSEHVIWFPQCRDDCDSIHLLHAHLQNESLNSVEVSRMRAYIWIFISAVMF